MTPEEYYNRDKSGNLKIAGWAFGLLLIINILVYLLS